MSARHRLLLPVAALLFGLTACGATPSAAPPASTSGTGTAPAATSPAPIVTASQPVATASKPAPPKASKPVSTQPAEKISCPSAAALERVARARSVPKDESLPENWHIPASSVKCWRAWATADPEGPEPSDGVYLFHYKPGTGWRYHSQGSGYHCEDLDIHEPAPFCQYPG